jgi:hypothetical protein
MYATISSHGATDGCAPYEGKVVKLVSEAPGSYPTVDELRSSNKIFHPNCKHTIIPIRDPRRISGEDHELPQGKDRNIDNTLDSHTENVDNGKYTTRLDSRDLPTGDKGRAVHIHTYPDGLEMIVPADIDWSQQTYTQDQIRQAYEALPSKLREGVKEIKLLDGRNEYDMYWEKKYKMKNFRSFATGGGGQINFFANETFGKQSNDDYLAHVMAHEAAHVLDGSLKVEDGRWFSDQLRWNKAKGDDTRKGSSEWVSDYARQSEAIHEDFADAVALYVEDKGYFKWKYPNRTKLIEEVLGDG